MAELVNFESLLASIDTIKKELDILRPLSVPAVLHALDIEYTYESNRIEGNTLTLNETALIIDKGLTISGKPMREHLEALNHYEAVLFLRDVIALKRPLTESLLKEIHALVLHGIDRDNCGKYRTVPVLISGSTHEPPPPFKVPDLMVDCFSWYERVKGEMHPVALAIEMHERVTTIHPFIDGNGRTSRLIMNLILLQNGYPIANISGEAESRRSYYDALEYFNKTGDKEPYLLLIAKEVLRSGEKLLRISKG